MRTPLYTPRMTRVSPPDDARECPAPHASTSVTRIPARRSASAVQPPNAPAPTTTTCSLGGHAADLVVAARAVGRPDANRQVSGAPKTAPTNARREMPDGRSIIEGERYARCPGLVR